MWRQHIHKVVLRLPDSWSNWNLEMLVFEERGKPEYPEKNLSEQRREPTTNSTHIWRRRRDMNSSHTGGRRVLSLLRHPFLPRVQENKCHKNSTTVTTTTTPDEDLTNLRNLIALTKTLFSTLKYIYFFRKLFNENSLKS